MKRFLNTNLYAAVIATIFGAIFLTSEPVCAQNFKQTNDPAMHGQTVNIHGLDMTLLYDGSRSQDGVGQPSFRSLTSLSWNRGGNTVTSTDPDSLFFGTVNSRTVRMGAAGQTLMSLGANRRIDMFEEVYLNNGAIFAEPDELIIGIEGFPGAGFATDSDDGFVFQKNARASGRLFSMDVDGNITPTGSIRDSYGSIGDVGQFLTTTHSGKLSWVWPTNFGDNDWIENIPAGVLSSTYNSLHIGEMSSAAPQNGSISATAGQGLNIQGADLSFHAGYGTGEAPSGVINFFTNRGNATGSGSGLNIPLDPAMTLGGSSLVVGGAHNPRNIRVNGSGSFQDQVSISDETGVATLGLYGNDGADFFQGVVSMDAGDMIVSAGTDTKPANSLQLLINEEEAMRIDDDANVGIGTTTPSKRLSVQGGYSIQESFGVNQDLRIMTDANLLWGDGHAISYGTADFSADHFLGRDNNGQPVVMSSVSEPLAFSFTDVRHEKDRFSISATNAADGTGIFTVYPAGVEVSRSAAISEDLSVGGEGYFSDDLEVSGDVTANSDILLPSGGIGVGVGSTLPPGYALRTRGGVVSLRVHDPNTGSSSSGLYIDQNITQLSTTSVNYGGVSMTFDRGRGEIILEGLGTYSDAAAAQNSGVSSGAMYMKPDGTLAIVP